MSLARAHMQDVFCAVRWVAVTFLLLFSLQPFSVVNAAHSTCDQLRANLMKPGVQEAIDNAIASNPFLAGNPAAAAAWMGMLAQEGAFNPAANSGSSFGLGQINYSSNQANLDAAYLAAHPGTQLPSDYNQRKAIVGQWIIDNPSIAAQMSAKIFQDKVRAMCGSSVTEECLWKGVQAYNCNIYQAAQWCAEHNADFAYAQKVRDFMNMMAACGIGPQGSGITPPPPAQPPMTPSAAALAGKCPDTALNLSITEAMANFVKGVITAASNALSATPQTMPRDFKKATCFDYIQKFDEVMNTIINIINAQYGAIIKEIIKQIAIMILNAVCAYIAEALNNALNSVCLPLPDLKIPGLGLPNLGAQYCNGLSLGDIIQFKPMPFTETPPGPGQDIARGLLSRGGYTVPYQDKLPH